MTKVFLALGSNVGDKEKNIYNAVLLLQEKINNVRLANLYTSRPVGVENQPTFINTVLSGYTDLSPFELLNFIKKIEKNLGRKKRYRWGPREIDIDIIFYGNLILDTKVLKIPHPLLQDRDFVLKPLLELEPNFVHPKIKKTIIELYSNLSEFSIID
ncbi:MAG: 2-amino-4-hydroxy-6-hydroxymethyldihydropteridine diphosphokinase [Aquificae bacterium]|nr:2-amino-4-hydroxy-6-hydroxymethyldihydropteridine diphosphokinase [Aquificota bacterium]